MNTIEQVMTSMREIVDSADGRTLTADEVTRYEALEADLAAARADAEVRGRQQAYETPITDSIRVGSTGQGDRPVHPLAYTPQAIAELSDAVQHHRAAHVDHNLAFTNAALTTGTFGQPGGWGANVLSGPRLLHFAAGVPQQPLDAVAAEFPSMTLPTVQGAAAEGASLAEFSSSTGGSVVLGAFGRFTDLTRESQFGTSVAPIVGMHQLGVARDLDNALINAVETAAGAAVAFNANVEAQIRKAIAKVIDNTAAADAGHLVVLVNPDNADLLQDVSPIGGSTIGEPFQRFAGALVYPSAAVDTGFMTVANLSVGVRYFEAQALRTRAAVQDIKTDTLTVATAVVAGYAITVTTGFAIKQDVVTP